MIGEAGGGTSLDPIRCLEVPLRHWRAFLAASLSVLLATAALYMAAPRIYRSTTAIIVESDAVPESVAPRVASSSPARRLLTIKQEILSRTRLEQVEGELHPYPDLLRSKPLSSVVEKMRGAISVQVRGTDSFSIQFAHRDPQMAMAVTERLASLFITETLESRRQQVENALRFLEGELEAARRELEEQEEILRIYKQKHLGALPEQLLTNLSTLQRLQLEDQTLEASIRAAHERQMLVEASARVGPAIVATPGSPAELDLNRLRTELAELRTRYTEEHPEVRRLQIHIQRLESQISGQPSGAAGPVPAVALPGPGSRLEREQAAREVEDLTAKRHRLEERIAAIQDNVELTPKVEEDLVGITRDYSKLKDRYATLLAKKLDTQMADKMEKEWQGERFLVLDPANLPERPSSPSLFFYLVAGLAGSLCAGIGAAVLAEYLDRAVRSSGELEAVLGHPVLVSIPHISTRRRLQGRKPKALAG